jgi:hypothetical protein
MSAKKKSLRPVNLQLTIPVHDDLDTGEMLVGGFRQEMISVGEKGTEAYGTLMTGTGLGSDVIHMEWRGRKALLFGRDLFKAWVATFAPEDAERMP